MQVTAIETCPQFMASVTGIRRNEASKTVVDAFNRAKDAYDRYQATFAGAVIAKVFQDRPYLASFVFELSASGEYDDQGGTYRSISVSVCDVEAVPGADIPEDFELDGALDTDAVADDITSVIEDESAHEMYVCFISDDYSYDDVRIAVTRESIADLLVGPEISGHDAYVRLFPECACLVAGEVAGELPTVGVQA